MSKVCVGCKKDNTQIQFGSDKRTLSGLRSRCNECRKTESSPEDVKARGQRWYIKNRSKVLKNVQAYKKAHIDWWRKYTNNYDKINAKESIIYKIKRNLRARLRAALKHNLKQGSAVQELGCSVDYFRKYLESKFYGNMSWDTYGLGKDKWQIDHIVPIKSFDFTNKEQFKKAVHYTNLQPLWYIDHVLKTKEDRRSYK